MPLSYKNIVDTNKLKDVVGGNASASDILKTNIIEPRYIQGYADDTFWEAIANKLGVNKGIVQQLFGLEKKRLDDYDPYHTNDAKIENFFDTDAKAILKKFDENTFTFKHSLNKSEDNSQNKSFLYDDPLLPGFQIFIDPLSPLFSDNTKINGISSFIFKYFDLDEISARGDMWYEFKNIITKIFETVVQMGNNNNMNDSNPINMPYFINKIDGLDNFKKKIIKYGEDKITITLNENISMISIYLAELYNNLTYSFKNQRYLFPENVLRFNLVIKISDVRNFLSPTSTAQAGAKTTVNVNNINGSSPIVDSLSEKSAVYYTLHDCNFNFFNSTNFNDSIEIGGHGAGSINSPSSVSFDIFFKSVSRWSTFPLIPNSYKIDGWGDQPITQGTNETKYFEGIDALKSTPPDKKGYLNQQFGKLAQTAANIAVDYADNLESYLRDLRGGLVEGALQSLQDSLNINKIEPDNVYNKDFNNRLSLANAGNKLAAGLLNDLTGEARNIANF